MKKKTCKRCEKKPILEGYCQSCAIVTIPKKYMDYRDKKKNAKSH